MKRKLVDIFCVVRRKVFLTALRSFNCIFLTVRYLKQINKTSVFLTFWYLISTYSSLWIAASLIDILDFDMSSLLDLNSAQSWLTQTNPSKFEFFSAIVFNVIDISWLNVCNSLWLVWQRDAMICSFNDESSRSLLQQVYSTFQIVWLICMWRATKIPSIVSTRNPGTVTDASLDLPVTSWTFVIFAEFSKIMACFFL